MKLNKTISALALALGVASVAQAQQQIYITGSTAFRAQVYNALHDLGLSVQYSATTGNNNFNFTGTVNSSVPTYSGGTYNNLSAGQSFTVICAFTGSSEGLNSLINDVSPSYTSPTNSSISYSYLNGADLAFCDVQQASTPYPTGAVNELNSADGAASSFGAGVAIVPFTWAAAADANGKVGNVTPYILNDILPLGQLPLSYFDGVASDSGTPVYLTGRTNDSGTRITAELTDGLPTASFDPSQPIIQWAVGGVVSSVGTGVWENVGNNGYSSGGNVAKALSVTGAGDAIGYVAWSDSASLSHGALPITFTGANPTTVSPITTSSWTAGTTAWNIAGLENGQYTFWSYEHLYESTKVAGTSVITTKFGPDLINAIEHEIVTTSPQTADVIGHMNVNRSNDGGDINPGN
jgi:hypothetical protein